MSKKLGVSSIYKVYFRDNDYSIELFDSDPVYIVVERVSYVSRVNIEQHIFKSKLIAVAFYYKLILLDKILIKNYK